MNRKPYGHYQKKSSLIKRNSKNKQGTTAKIVLWDYFLVDRQTGKTLDNCCRVQLLDGDNSGKFRNLHCSSIGEHKDAAWTWSN